MSITSREEKRRLAEINHARLVDWASKLSVKELRVLAVELTDYLITVDTVHFHEEALSPYWESCGDPLVPGQVAFPPED